MTLDKITRLLLSHPSDSHAFTSLDGEFTVLTRPQEPDPQEDTLWFDTVNLHTYYAGRWLPLETFPYRQPVLVSRHLPRPQQVTDLGHAHLSFAPVNDQEVADVGSVLDCDRYLRSVEESVAAYIQNTSAEFDRLQVEEVTDPDHVVNRQRSLAYLHHLLGRARSLAQSAVSRNLRLQELENRVSHLHQRLSHVSDPEYVRATGTTFQGSVSIPDTLPIDEEELVSWGKARSMLTEAPEERVVQKT